MENKFKAGMIAWSPSSGFALVEMNEKMRTALENIRDIADDDRMNADCIARHVLAEVKA